jgi:PII-like signaling protein
MMVVAVGPAGRIGMMLPELAGLLRHPLMTLERVRICKRDGQLIDIPEPAVEADDRGFPLWQKLTVYTPEAARHNGRPIHRVDVRRLRLAGISGATTHRGFWGFHGERPPHGDRFLRLGQHVPMVMTVIDTAERIIAAFAVIDELTKEQGLVTSETVPGIRAISGHQQPGKL